MGDGRQRNRKADALTMSLPFYRVFSSSDALAMALMTAEERGAYHYLRNLSWVQVPPATLPDDD
jgi:hypothetical protein